MSSRRMLMVHMQRAELPCGLRVTVLEAVLIEESAPLPRPSRVPDVEREYRAAVAKCAPGFRAECITSTGSTLRLLPSRAA